MPPCMRDVDDPALRRAPEGRQAVRAGREAEHDVERLGVDPAVGVHHRELADGKGHERAGPPSAPRRAPRRRPPAASTRAASVARPTATPGAAVAAVGLEHQLLPGVRDVLGEVSPGAVRERGGPRAQEARPRQVPAEEGAVLAAEVARGRAPGRPAPPSSSSGPARRRSRTRPGWWRRPAAWAARPRPRPRARADPRRRSRGRRGRSPGPGRSPPRRRGRAPPDRHGRPRSRSARGCSGPARPARPGRSRRTWARRSRRSGRSARWPRDDRGDPA